MWGVKPATRPVELVIGGRGAGTCDLGNAVREGTSVRGFRSCPDLGSTGTRRGRETKLPVGGIHDVLVAAHGVSPATFGRELSRVPFCLHFAAPYFTELHLEHSLLTVLIHDADARGKRTRGLDLGTELVCLLHLLDSAFGLFAVIHVADTEAVLVAAAVDAPVEAANAARFAHEPLFRGDSQRVRAEAPVGKHHVRGEGHLQLVMVGTGSVATMDVRVG
uniref:Uncharacterized protein n=1 Tax=Physcomitrium patens TaxID=3218 RepID=A0A2K1IHV4_PHYPA|nr:hypothetical protein PHYPA_027540 [Physcomitrium patens]